MRGFLRRNAIFGLCGSVLCTIGMVAPTVTESQITSGHVPEEQKLNYGVSCIAETDNPTVLIAPSLDKPIGRNIGFDPGYGFFVDGFVHVDGTQFLKGMMSNRAGRLISKGLEFQGPDRNELFVLASQWDCTLYRGELPWPATQK